jgi:gliding motility-associated-like protein
MAASTAVKAQQVTFAISPTQVSPAVGDTLKLNISVQNFTNIVSVQYAIEWDGALLSFVGIDSVSMPDQGNFLTNAFGGNTLLTSWNASGTAKSAANGQRFFRLRLKVLAASSNYWARFSDANTSIEVIQDPGLVSITPIFINLGTPPGNTNIPLGGKVTGGSTLTNQKFCVPVTTTDFTNIVTAQWVNKWNPAVLRFDSISTLNNTLGLRAANFGTTQASSGRLAFSWNAPSGSVSVNNNDTLYKMCYTAIGANGTNSIVTFDSAEIYRRGIGDSRVALNGVNGTVTVGNIILPPSSGLVFAASNHVVNTGESVCVKVRTAGFTDIAVLQWSIHWDSTKMTLTGANSTAGLGIAPWVSTTNQGDFNNLINGNPSGTLRFLWVSPSGNGFTLADSTVLMELCFTYIGAAGTNSPVRFDGIPLKIQVKDGNLANVPSTFRIGNVSVSSSSAVTVSATTQNVNCPSGTDGKITLTTGGGNGAFTYSWTGPNGFTATSKDIAAGAAGKYYVTVTSGTLTKVDSFSITQPAAFATSTQLTHVSCKGGSNGAIVLTASGGTAPYTYSWLNPSGTTSTTKDLSNLTAGIYKLTLTDSKSCTTTRIDTITEPTLLTVTTVATNVSCKNGQNGAITTTASGGTLPYTYTWIAANSTSFSTKDLSGLTAGVYRLTVTDAKNCSATKTETITEPDSISIGTFTVRGTRCSQPMGAITINTVTGGNGGYTFSWAGPNSSTFSSKDIANVAPGQYVLTIKDTKNCSFVKTFNIVDTAANITNSDPSVTAVTCNNGSNGAITLTATGSGPLTYAWTGPGGYTASILSISNLKAGNYTLAITDAGCAKTLAVTVPQPTAIATAIQSVNVKCKGESSGSIALNATGGTGTLTITWTGTGGFIGTGQSISSLKAGTYNAIIKDGNLCEKTESITISEPTDSLKITNAVITPIACNGGSNGSIAITVAGGTPQYAYAWTGIGGFTSTQKDIAGRSAGEYRLTVTDGNGCRAERVFNLIDPPAIVVTAGTTDASGSPNGTISLTVAGGQQPYTYVWTGQGVAPTAQNQTGLCPGTYNVTVKDLAQCSIAKQVTVGGSCSTPMRVIGTPAITNAGCVGQNLGKITINWEGGVAPFTVEWVLIVPPPGMNQSVSTETVQARSSMLINRQAGSYAIKITDAVGQTLATPPMVITQSATPVNVTAAISNETCRGNDGAIVLTIRDGAAPYIVMWGHNPANVTEFTNLTARPQPYTAIVKDNNGCLKEMNDMYVRRTPCPLTIASSKTNPTCFNGNNGSITINISNGEPTYTLTLPSGQVTTIPNILRTGTFIINGLGAGTHIIKIKDTANVEQTITHILTNPDQLVVNKTITGDNGTCTGSIILNPTGGVGNYTYQWNTGATSRDLFNLCCNDGRRYSVIVKDGNQCEVSTNNDVIPCNIAILSLDSSIVRNPVCKSDSMNSRIDVFVRGGVLPYTYEWKNQIGTVVGTNSPILLNQPPGRYYLTVVDSRTPNAQRIVFDALLKVSSTLAITNVAVTNAEDNLSFGSATLTISVGTGPYSVRWPDGTTTTTQTNIATNTMIRVGTWEVLVTDIQGCVVKQTITIRSNACATISINSVFYTPKDTVNIRCANNCDGRATVLGFSSTVVLPIRSYQWTSGEVGPSAFKLCPGINEVTVTDANGGRCSTRIFMKAPLPLKDTIWVDDKARTLEAVPSGGVQPYKYLWSNDNFDKTAKITVTKAGGYVVTIEDALGCSIQDRVKVTPDATCLEGAPILTPNDDGLNENFRIKACDYKTVRLEIYNRWGQLVYSSNDYKEQWYGNKQDGQSGEPLPDGVYMYILSATDATGKQELGKGTVNILRN